MADNTADNLKTSLRKIMDIDGALGAALVDYESGETLGAIDDEEVNIERAAMGNTEVVRVKTDVMKQLRPNGDLQDILITLDDQYHLIRLLRDAEGVCAYVVLEKDKSNLALARLSLRDLDGQLGLKVRRDNSDRSSASQTGSSPAPRRAE